MTQGLLKGSSYEYNNANDGIAIKTKIKVGTIVQKISNLVPCRTFSKNKNGNLFKLSKKFM